MPAGVPQVAVVAHVHYPELWGDIEDRLARMPQEFDLFVTITEGAAEAVVPDILRRHNRARIGIVPNRGRDWAPLVALANEGALSGYTAIAKVHTKKSEHRMDGDGWRLALLDGIFESPEAIQRIIDLLEEDRATGLVVPTGHVAGPEHWGGNLPIVEALASRLPMAFDPASLQFPGGSMFWCRPWLLERLADLCLTSADFEVEAGQYDSTTAHALERMVGTMAVTSGMSVIEVMDVGPRLRDARRAPRRRSDVWAFFLPQYHQVPENDEFWGEGFTDWDRVRSAAPLFHGHRVPLVPSDPSGYYDLSQPQVLAEQAALAKTSGVDAFLMHYYWFDGRKVLRKPLDNWLRNSDIDFPMAICWANESWTRRWDGLDKEVLIAQTYPHGWADRFWDDARQYLSDPRYLRVDASPVLVVYRLGEIPDPRETVALWRRRALESGLPGLHVVAVEASRDVAPIATEALALIDDVILFPPGSGITLHDFPPTSVVPADLRRHVLSYAAAIPEDSREGNLTTIPGVMPGWDNTARRGRSGYLFHGSNPCDWAAWLRVSERRAGHRGRPVIAINAWNEWAEGAVLEPTRRWGGGYLRTLADVFGTISTRDRDSDSNG